MYALCTPSVCVFMMFGGSQSNKVKRKAVASMFTGGKKEHCSFLDPRVCDDGRERSEVDQLDFNWAVLHLTRCM